MKRTLMLSGDEMMRKKTVSLLLVLLLMTALSITASADYTEGYFEYILGDNCIEITGYFGDETETTVPARIAGYPVCVIRSGAFSQAESLSVIHLPDCIMEVQAGAFGNGQSVLYDPAASVRAPAQTQPGNTSGTVPAETGNSGTTAVTTSGNSTGVPSLSGSAGSGSAAAATATPEITPAPGQMILTDASTSVEEVEMDSGIESEQLRKAEARAAQDAENEKVLAEQKAADEVAAQEAEQAAVKAAEDEKRIEQELSRRKIVLTAAVCLVLAVILATVLIRVLRRR